MVYIMSRDDFLWAEKYRPQTVEDCILPESIKTTLQEYVNRKEIPNLILATDTAIYQAR